MTNLLYVKAGNHMDNVDKKEQLMKTREKLNGLNNIISDLKSLAIADDLAEMKTSDISNEQPIINFEDEVKKIEKKILALENKMKKFENLKIATDQINLKVIKNAERIEKDKDSADFMFQDCNERIQDSLRLNADTNNKLMIFIQNQTHMIKEQNLKINNLTNKLSLIESKLVKTPTGHTKNEVVMELKSKSITGQNNNGANKRQITKLMNDYITLEESKFRMTYSPEFANISNYSAIKMGVVYDHIEIKKEQGIFWLIRDKDIEYLLPCKNEVSNVYNREIIKLVFNINKSTKDINIEDFTGPCKLKKKDQNTWICVEKGSIE